MLRSLNCEEHSYIRFINKTNGPVDLYWVNFTGEHVRYDTLSKDFYLDVNTFKTHPWIAIDAINKDRMHIDKEFVFQPLTSREFLKIRHPGKYIPPNFETRIRIYVTLPMYSLKSAALLCVRNQFEDSSACDQLPLPKGLNDELKRSIDRRNERRIQYKYRLYQDRWIVEMKTLMQVLDTDFEFMNVDLLPF